MKNGEEVIKENQFHEETSQTMIVAWCNAYNYFQKLRKFWWVNDELYGYFLLCINISVHIETPSFVTWLNPTVPVFQFLTSSNGRVGMKGDVVAVAVVGDCVNPGANKLVESVIGTVTEKKTNKKS